MDYYEDMAFYNDRKVLITGNRLDKIRVLHTRILKFTLTHPEVEYKTLGADMFNAGQFQRSIFPLKKATIIDPSYCMAQRILAEAFLNIEKAEDCFLTIKKALSVSIYGRDLHRYLIEVLEKTNRFEDLGAFLNEIAESIKDSTSRSSFYSTIADILDSQKKYPQALFCYKQGAKINPKDLSLSCDYGLTLYNVGFFEEAIVQFEHVKKHAASLSPKAKQAWNNVAHLYYCLGRVEMAREEFEEIIAKKLDIEMTYSNFLLVLHHLGQDEEVLDKYKTLFQPYIISHRNALQRLYKEELTKTEATVQREDIDEKMREFNVKKLEGVNLVLSLLSTE